jgi:hypothetical protein
MIANTYDLTATEIGTIARRLDLALGRRPLLPLQSLQYRLGETGQRRIHPDALKRALPQLTQSEKAESVGGNSAFVRQIAPLLFTSADLDHSTGSLLLAERSPDLDTLARCDWTAGFAEFEEALATYTGRLAEVDTSESLDSRSLSDLQTVQHQSRVYRLTEFPAGSEIRIWATQDPDWLMADDPRLWANLEYCRAAGAHLLIIARKIDTASFVLFKALGIRGLQYFNMWAPQADRARVSAASDRLGWFSIKGGKEAHSHQIFNKNLGTTLATLRNARWEPDVLLALDMASTAGLAYTGKRVTAELLAWAEEAPLGLPEKWINTIRRYLAWTADTPLRSPPGTVSALKRSRSHPSARKNPLSTPAGEAKERAEGSKRDTIVTRVPVRGW